MSWLAAGWKVATQEGDLDLAEKYAQEVRFNLCLIHATVTCSSAMNTLSCLDFRELSPEGELVKAGYYHNITRRVCVSNNGVFGRASKSAVG